jgi:hypothetical protein
MQTFPAAPRSAAVGLIGLIEGEPIGHDALGMQVMMAPYPGQLRSGRASTQRREGPVSRGPVPPTRAPGRPVERVKKALQTAQNDATARDLSD